MPGQPKPQILAIDALRFASAAMVTAFHFLTILPLSDASPLRLLDPAARLPTGGAAWTWCGWIGVELFFVISGYVIASSVGTADRRTFLRRRMLRLAPVAWLCASLTAIVLLAGQALPLATVLPRWAASMLFLPVADQIDAAYWTLRVELAFYLLVAFTLRPDRHNDRRVELIGWGLAAWSTCYWLATVAAGATSQAAIDSPLLTLLLLPHGAFFALGIALRGIADRATPSRLALAGLAGTTCLVEIVVHASTMRDVPGIVAAPLWPMLIFVTGIAVIAAAAWLQRPLVALVGERTLTLLGRMTYPLYLLNLTIGAALIAALTELPAWAALAIAATIVCALAYGIARYLERPLRDRLARRLDALTRRRGPPRDSLPSASLPGG